MIRYIISFKASLCTKATCQSPFSASLKDVRRQKPYYIIKWYWNISSFLILLLYLDFQNQFNYFQSQSCVLKTISAVIYLAYKQRTTKLVSRRLFVVPCIYIPLTYSLLYRKDINYDRTNKHTWLSIWHYPCLCACVLCLAVVVFNLLTFLFHIRFV